MHQCILTTNTCTIAYSQLEDFMEEWAGAAVHNLGAHGPVEGEEGTRTEGHGHVGITHPIGFHCGKV